MRQIRAVQSFQRVGTAPLHAAQYYYPYVCEGDNSETGCAPNTMCFRAVVNISRRQGLTATRAWESSTRQLFAVANKDRSNKAYHMYRSLWVDLDAFLHAIGLRPRAT